MRKRLLAAAVSVLMLCSCSMSMSVADMLEPPRMTEQQSAIYDALETAIGTDSFKLKYPRSGKNLSACTLQDLDGDGKEEAVVFYELESGGSTATWISILTQQDGGWKSVKQISGEAGEIDRLDFASILGKTKTVLVGWTATGEENSGITEDSVLLNGNSRIHLNLSVGQSITLKAYRAWEIIAKSYQNYIIPPDFTYTVLQGNDVISLTEKKSPSAGKGDWMTLTALKEGVAVIEVTYDAIETSGGDYERRILLPRLLQNGQIDHWPEGFFDEWDNSLLELL